jgi:polysaccharide biosynthesis transport protein
MDDHQLTLADYIAIVRRRSWLVAVAFLLTLVAGVAAALLIPAVYRSTGTILIESQQIPTDLIQATVTSYADERIEVIKQRVMTRENLLRIIRKYQLFAGAGVTFTPSDQIDEMRKTITVDLVSANVRAERRGAPTIAFSVSFEHGRPQVAQAVANDLVTLFLDENVKVRTQRASQTTEFLTQEAEKLKKELYAIEAQIASYKQEHGRALPENAALGLAALQRVESDLRQVERDHAATEEELRALETERELRRAQQPASAAAAQPELQRARAELARLAASYTERHPDFQAARRRLESVEQAAGGEAGQAVTPVERADAVLARMEARSATLGERLKVLGAQRTQLRARLGQLDVALVRLPEVERGLASLTRDYHSAQKKYEEILAKKMTAQVAENLEGEQKAERFTLLEPPTQPDKPLKPDRKKLLALSLVLALAVPAGLVILLEGLHGTVRGAGQISAILGHQPLVLVPFIPIASEVATRRRMVFLLAGGGLLAGGAAVAAVHFLVLPLDLVLMKALIRLG